MTRGPGRWIGWARTDVTPAFVKERSYNTPSPITTSPGLGIRKFPASYTTGRPSNSSTPWITCAECPRIASTPSSISAAAAARTSGTGSVARPGPQWTVRNTRSACSRATAIGPRSSSTASAGSPVTMPGAASPARACGWWVRSAPTNATVVSPTTR